VARLGCLAAGCCAGAATPGWAARAGAPPAHPVALYEIAGLAALHGIVTRVGTGRVMPLALVGIGALRLAVEPFRAPPLGPPLVPSWLLAACWCAAGAIAHAASRSSSARAAPNSAPGSRSETRA
jgi:hypothetical protein